MAETAELLSDSPARAELGTDRAERSAPARARSAVVPQGLQSIGSPSENEAGALARQLGVFASPNRLRILWELVDGEQRVGILAQRLGISPSLTSHQLGILRKAEIVLTRRAGTRVYYRLHDTNLRDLLIAVRAHHASSALRRTADFAFAKEQAALAATVPTGGRD